jgi:hypothetical protein
MRESSEEVFLAPGTVISWRNGWVTYILKNFYGCTAKLSGISNDESLQDFGLLLRRDDGKKQTLHIRTIAYSDLDFYLDMYDTDLKSGEATTYIEDGLRYHVGYSEFDSSRLSVVFIEAKPNILWLEYSDDWPSYKEYNDTHVHVRQLLKMSGVRMAEEKTVIKKIPFWHSFIDFFQLVSDCFNQNSEQF